MKKIFVMLALTMGVVSANAQSVDSTAVTNTVAGDVTLTTDIYPQQEDGDIYHGLTKKLTFDRMIPPYGLEVTLYKVKEVKGVDTRDNIVFHCIYIKLPEKAKQSNKM